MKRIAAKYIVPITSGPIKNGYVDIDDNGIINDIGEWDGCVNDETDYYEGAICPGFTNAHCHIELSHLKGIFKEGTGMSGFINQINELRENAVKEERLKAIRREMGNLYSQGVSAMGDISNCNESFAIKSESGIYTHSYIELFGTIASEAIDILENGKKLKEEANLNGLDASVTPHSCYTMSPELLAIAAKEGLKEGYISYHSQESPEEEELIISGTGALADNYKGRNLPTPPVTGKPSLCYFIERLTSFSTTPIKGKIMLVHNVATNEESIDCALQNIKEPFWTICPLSNLFIHRALPPIGLMKSKGLTICIGTDSLSSNKRLSIIDEIKCINHYFPQIELTELLKWATVNGANALGKGDVYGTLEKGKKPGIVLIEKITEELGLTADSSSKRII
jgi:aminodeoxyfutalosine deaminase